MNLLRRFPAMAFALVLVAIAGFCVATESFGLLVVAGALAAMSWYVTEGPRGRTLPRWVANVLLVAALLNAGVDWASQRAAGEVMGVVGRFTLWLSIIKLYEAKGIRDYGQLLALSAVLMTAGALQTVQLSYAILLVVYVLLGLHTALLFQLWMGYERARQARRRLAPEAARLVPPVQPAAGRHLGRSFVGTGATLAVGAAAVAILVFIVFPRGLILRDGAGASGLARRQAGFSEEVRLNESPRISESRREVFTAQLLDPQDVPIRFPEPLRLRGAVLDQYSPIEGRWVASKVAQTTARPVVTEGMETFVELGDRPIDQRIQTYTLDVTMRSMVSDTVFAPYAPIALAGDAGRPFSFEPASLVLRDRRGSQLGAYASYRVRVQPYATAAAMQALVGEAGRQRTVAGFPIETVRKEAVRILRERDVPVFPPEDATAEEKWRHRQAVARAFLEELHSPRFSYTTDLSDFTLLRGEDPVSLFLLRHRFGHCEHFASAMTALCRSVGVEARLVTGFIAMEYDEGAERYVVRESNAHAWVEVRTGPYTWATFDPTPPDTLAALNESRRSWIDRWRWIWDRIEFMWNNRFVGFDSSVQSTLMERASQGWTVRIQQALDALREWLAQVNAAFRLGPAGYIWLALVGLVAVVAVLALSTVVRRWSRIRRIAGLERSPRGTARRLVRELGFWLDASTVLARAGIERPAWQPPRDFAAGVSAERPELAAPLRRLVDRFYAVRYGGAAMTSGDVEAARAEVMELARALGVRAPR